jgi:DNA polymerase III delta prime subunit
LNRSIDDVREKIITFASTYSFDAVKIIILDEADGMTPQALDSLKGVVEKYSEHVRFIFTTNQIDKIPEPIWSRCSIYNLENTPLKEIGQRCFKILNQEGIEFEKQGLVNLIKYYSPDIRKTISSLELCSKTGTLIFDPSKVSKDYFSEVIEIINSKENIGDKFYRIRQIILDNDLKNLDQVYSLFFQNLKYFSKGKDCEITIALADSLHKSVTIPDKELNLMSCISKILTITK